MNLRCHVFRGGTALATLAAVSSPTLAVRVPPEIDRRVRIIARVRGRELADELRAALATPEDEDGP
jgi:hypothetical protein